MRDFYEIRMRDNFSKEEIADFREGLKACKVAENLQEGIMLYFEQHILPGRFLTACMENNLVDALKYASTKTWDYIFGVINFLYNYVPTYTWGSKEIVTNWVKCKGKGV